MPISPDNINPDLRPNRDIYLLAPIVKDKLLIGLEKCHSRGLKVEMFEGFRTPQRQEFLYKKGRETEGPIATRAKAWESLHQYGLACDLCFKNEHNDWTWSGPWATVLPIFGDLGFELLSFEKDHIQISGKLTWENCFLMMKRSGLQSVWQHVASKH